MIGDIYEYRELVLQGIPKIFIGEEFESEEERNAVMNFIQSKGIPLSSQSLGERMINSQTIEERTQIVIDACIEGILNTFRGQYGI